MILEGLITTVDATGLPHVSALGVEVDPDFARMELRPFRTSRTYEHLIHRQQAVFHVSDDVESIARVVCGGNWPVDAFEPARQVEGFILRSACRAYELQILTPIGDGLRVAIPARIVATHRLREFFGFNRAKHAVVEAAILATRLGFLPREEIESKWACLKPLVEKTGGPSERAAFEKLSAFVAQAQRTPAELLPD
jgi:hypothetical protein